MPQWTKEQETAIHDRGGALLVSAAGVYLVLTVLFRAAASHGLRGERLAVTVMLLGKTASFTALRDTAAACGTAPAPRF